MHDRLPTDFSPLILSFTDLFECNASCGCGSNCPNRVTQREPFNSSLPFYLFRTAAMCWGVKCESSIVAGSYIGSYHGLRKTEEEARTDEEQADSAAPLCDEYMSTVDPTSLHAEDMHELKPLLKNHPAGCRTIDALLAAWPRVTIDAFSCGSLVRFVNHSCAPNLTAVQVFTENRSPNMANIASVQKAKKRRAVKRLQA